MIRRRWTAALAPGDVACVVTEPALTNIGVSSPRRASMPSCARLTRDHGTLLVIDETHTQVCGPGGLTGRWGLEPDLVTLGKSAAGGMPFGAYGMTRGAGRRLRAAGPGRSARRDRHRRHPLRQRAVDGRRTGRPGGGADGGGLRADRRPGHALADGIEAVARTRGSPGGPTGSFRDPAMPTAACCRTTPRGAARISPGRDRSAAGLLRQPRRLGGDLLRRPCVGIAHTEADVDQYLNVLAEFTGVELVT